MLIRRSAGDYADLVDACELATDNGSGMPAAGWLVLQFQVGVRYNADSVIRADPDDERGIWGSDLQAELLLTRSDPDWRLVNRIWALLVTLWQAIAWEAQQMWGDGEAEAKYDIRGNCYLCGKRLRAGSRWGVCEQTPACRPEYRRPPAR